MKKVNYVYDLYTEWYGDKYVTTGKIFDKRKVRQIFNGCHWDDPRLIYAEQVDGTCAPSGFWELVDQLGAVDIDY